MTWTFLALAIAAPPPAEPPVVAVTGLFAGKKRTYDGRLSTQWEGFALTLVGSSETTAAVKAEDWTAAVKKAHIRVVFPKPHAIKGPGKDGGKTFEVTEILFRVADTGVITGLWVRCGSAYYAFEKYNTALALFIEERHIAPLK